jgi:hypothetical protein
MKKVRTGPRVNIFVLVLLAVTLIVNGQFQIRHASFVQAAVGSNSAFPGTCTFSSNVTSGDREIVASNQNNSVIIGVTSTRVTSWIFLGTTNHSTVYSGVATSSGSETITMTGTGSTANLCGEWNTNTLDQFNVQDPGSTATVTTTHAISDLVCVGAGGAGGGLTLNSPIVTRVTNGGTNIVLGDQQVTSTGTYSCGNTAVFPYTILANFYSAGGIVQRRR